jgi:MinD-like ATPase involved in chromosome partitioning or flagellar assembly
MTEVTATQANGILGMPSRQRGWARLWALAMSLAFALAGEARAGEFTINACQADRTNFSTQAFEDFATRGMISPKGGVGKTTSTFLVGNLLASHLKLRVIALDANPDFGTLGRLPGDHLRSARSLADLLRDAETLGTAAELRSYVSKLPSGLHVLAAPSDASLTATLDPERYGSLIAFLSCFYDAVLLDLGTGVVGPLARFAIERADQVVLVTTPEWITASVVLEALDHLKHERTTVAVNKARPRADAELRVVEDMLRRERLHRSVTIPYDERLAVMLDSGTYSLEALGRRTRLPVKRLGLAVAELLV